VTVDEQIEIVVDGNVLAVQKGERLIDAAERHGIRIPRFCYRKGSPMGSCFICAVALKRETGVAWVRSCMEFVKPGMEISTDPYGPNPYPPGSRPQT
jgi:NADH dehydrogenase/NADH:ubiquinone oxidoreductase subunit G